MSWPADSAQKEASQGFGPTRLFFSDYEVTFSGQLLARWKGREVI
jgi:hypothetical protein